MPQGDRPVIEFAMTIIERMSPAGTRKEFGNYFYLGKVRLQLGWIEQRTSNLNRARTLLPSARCRIVEASLQHKLLEDRPEWLPQESEEVTPGRKDPGYRHKLGTNIVESEIDMPPSDRSGIEVRIWVEEGEDVWAGRDSHLSIIQPSTN